MRVISKFLEVLQVDTIREVKYKSSFLSSCHCVCGQPIKKGYLFENIRNNRKCVVGKNCLKHIASYLMW